jgi:fimbrial chaperone protein
MGPGQKAAVLTVANQGTGETTVQVRIYAWNQKDGEDRLVESSGVVVSPPLATIGPGASQVIRLMLRETAQTREDTYRLIVDQIPPPAAAGTVQISLRMSIPVFALPAARTTAHLVFHIESDGGKSYLVASNDGGRHEVIRDVAVATGDGRHLKPSSDASPYILAGATRRWPIPAQEPLAPTGKTLQLTARSDSGAIAVQVPVVDIR